MMAAVPGVRTAEEAAAIVRAVKFAPIGERGVTLDELEAKGFINAERVAESVLHRRSGRFGAARIRRELQDKGLDLETVQHAVERLRATEFERAREVWRRRFGEPAPDAAGRAKQMRFLAARGFGADAIRRVVGGAGDDEALFDWLDPQAPPEETAGELHVEALGGGRWLRLQEQGRVADRPHTGEALLGFHRDAQQFELCWVDSFHTGSAMMLSVGAVRADGVISVTGSYAAGGERWGWRTELRLEPTLTVRAVNISPAGEEHPAIESRWTRVS